MDANIVFSLVVRKALTKEHAVVGKNLIHLCRFHIRVFKNLKNNKKTVHLLSRYR